MRRWMGRILFGLLGTMVLLVGLSTFRALQVRGDLLAARLAVNRVQHQLVTGDLDRASAALPGLRTRLDRSSGRTSGPLWRLTQHLPLVGGDFRAIRRVALAGQILGDQTLPEAEAALEVARRNRLIVRGRVDLEVLARLQAHVDQAAASSARARALIETPQRLLLPPVGSGVAEARARVRQLDAALSSARRSLAVAPELLGAQRPQHFFVAVQNNAEARATGGLIGAFALVSTDKGQIRLDRTGTNLQLHTAFHHVPADPAAAKLWQDLGSTGAWYAANFTPHFPDAASNIAGLWAAQSGQRVDGVLAIDPIDMRELLRATGPVRLPDGTRIDAGDVMAFVGHDEYVRYPDIARRKDLLSNLAATLFRRVIQVQQPLALVQAFARLGGSGHFFAWTQDPSVESQLTAGAVGGALPTTNVPYLSVLTQNFDGNKLDYYIRRRVIVTRVGSGQIRVEVRLSNIAPPGLPAYMTVRTDRPKKPLPYAEAEVGFSVYGALSSEVAGVWVDGRRTEVSFDRDHEHRMGTFALEVPRGEEVTVRVDISEPEGVLLYHRQPLVVADDLDLAVPHRLG